MVARTPKAPPPEPADVTGDNTGGHLLSFVERLERLAEEKSGIADDMKEVMSEAKGSGFDTKTLRTALARRRMDSATRQECDTLLALYETAIERAEKKAHAQSVEDGA
jgi:uncharacterized protein (UPF0335 family)